MHALLITKHYHNAEYLGWYGQDEDPHTISNIPNCYNCKIAYKCYCLTYLILSVPFFYPFPSLKHLSFLSLHLLRHMASSQVKENKSSRLLFSYKPNVLIQTMIDYLRQCVGNLCQRVDDR